MARPNLKYPAKEGVIIVGSDRGASKRLTTPTPAMAPRSGNLARRGPQGRDELGEAVL